MYSIIDLNDRQTEAIEAKLAEYDDKHMTVKLSGDVGVGILKDGELIAGASGCVTAFRIFYVSTVFVDENYRRQGIGRMLMEAVEEKAAALGANIIRLDTFDFQGADFYISLGYERVGFYECREDNFSEHFFVKRIKRGER